MYMCGIASWEPLVEWAAGGWGGALTLVSDAVAVAGSGRDEICLFSAMELQY